MFDTYQEIARHYKKLSIHYERELITSSKKGNTLARNELLLHLIGFFLYRINTTLNSSLIREYGEDIIQDCLLFAIKKIDTYNLNYKDKNGKTKTFHLSTYMWKGVTGQIINYLKNNKEVCFPNVSEFASKNMSN